MSTGTMGPFPPSSPSPKGGANDSPKCAFCGTPMGKSDNRAFYPLCYVRHSPDVLPVWQDDGSIQPRLFIPPSVKKGIRPAPPAASVVCSDCWHTCRQADQVCQETGIQLCDPEEF